MRLTTVVAHGIVVRFGGVAALSGVDLTLSAGSVHALCGENGAGKSTLMKVLAGSVRPDEGSVTIDGQPVTFSSPRDALAAGIRMVHQELSLVPALSVTENVLLGAESPRKTMRQRALNALARIGSGIDPDVRVETLSLADQQMVEIAKALASANTRVLILDEPTAILSPRECDALFACIKQLTSPGVANSGVANSGVASAGVASAGVASSGVASSGLAVLYCTHRLEEVARIADTVTVLRDGRLIASSPVAEMPRDAIVRHMVGRDVARAARTRNAPGAVALAVNNLSSGFVRDASFDVRYGEIVGLVGLVGAGRTELVRAIIGAAPIDGGAMTLDARPFRARRPADAIRHGFGFVPEDRKGAGLIMHERVRVNTTLARLTSFARWSIVDRRREQLVTREWIDRLHIKAQSTEMPVDRLSGGNQQKVVLTRWLLGELKVLIVDEPTRGVDVGARAEIYRILIELAQSGAAVIVVTSDLPEAAELCDRLLVMREGRLVGEADTAEGAGTMMVAGA
ncbi:MAG TPA: sugar ABC transporter ATP-binding protein [Gemmatimonadaceae bacterium]|nr:sugar ABC transporter ATP-binding protein [Gemmatimonadaceae bacterium]